MHQNLQSCAVDNLHYKASQKLYAVLGVSLCMALIEQCLSNLLLIPSLVIVL